MYFTYTFCFYIYHHLCNQFTIYKIQKVIKEKKAEPQKIRGFELKKLSKESLQEDKILKQLNEKKSR